MNTDSVSKGKKVLFIRNSCTLMSHSQMGYGVGIIATLASEGGYNVKIIDNNTHYKFYSKNDLARQVRLFKPDILAYSITIHNAYETYEQIKEFKKAFPGLIIIAGGVHMRHCFEEALRFGADAVVNREGEKVIVPLLDHLSLRGKSKFKDNLELIPGISFTKEDGSFHFAKEFPALENLDDVPVINYELFNIKDFVKTKTEPGIFYIVGQRGCPFSCTFCSDQVQRSDRRASSADWLLKNTVNLYAKYKINYLLIADNNFTLNRERVVDFCKKVIATGLNKKIMFSCQTSTRFDVDDGLLSLMKEAGFGRISFGLERLTPYSLSKINKEQPLEQVHRVFTLVSKYFVNPTIFMMIGFPFETKELLQEEKKQFLEMLKYSRRLFLSILCPTPGTIYYEGLPGMKEWYLSKHENLRFRAYFTNVLDMHTFNNIERNLFGFSDEIKYSLKDYYLTFKNICYGSVFIKKSWVLNLCMKLDFCVAKISQGLFAVSPELEFFVFRRLKALRYYLGNYFFSRNIVNH